MEILLKCFLQNIKTKEIVLINLKLISIITTQEREALKNQSQIDISLIIEIINEVLSNYVDHLDIIIQLTELIKNIFISSKEIWIKKILIDVIFNNSDKYISKQEYVELFLTTLYNMIKTDKAIVEMCCNSIIYYVTKNLNVNINKSMISHILKIMRHISYIRNIDFTSLLVDISKILKLFESQSTFHTDEMVILFSEIIANFCVYTSIYKEISTEFISMILEYAYSKEINSPTHSKLLVIIG